MRVLLTGGAGFIGSAVADVLAAAGHEVLTFDVRSAGAEALPTQTPGASTPHSPALDGRRVAVNADELPPWSGRHPLVVGDLRDAEVVRAALVGIDAVCHQAASVGHGLDPSDAPRYAANNDYATAVLLAEMYAAGIRRLVLASSMVVYGEGRYACDTHGEARAAPREPEALAAGRFDPPCPHCGASLGWQPVSEDARLEPRSTYAATKVAQEHLAGAWARQCGGEVWALRYHNVYGPRMPRDTPYAGAAAIFRSALAAGRAPRVFEDGRQTRDFVHVADVAEANLLALGAAPPASEGFFAVNICSGMPHTIGEFAATLASTMGGPAPIVTGEVRATDVRHIVASPGLAERALGFRARISLEDGLAEFARDSP